MLPKETEEVWNFLKEQKSLSGFVLIGGTALAIRIKHRTSKDLDRAMSHIAEDIVCEAPAGRIEGAAAYRDFMAPFVQMLVSANMIAAGSPPQSEPANSHDLRSKACRATCARPHRG